jgi:hypothetical protein
MTSIMLSKRLVFAAGVRWADPHWLNYAQQPISIGCLGTPKLSMQLLPAVVLKGIWSSDDALKPVSICFREIIAVD